ncbi:MAG: hypothetical protein SV375_22955, partial [Thermodesulfobacteriota bacterium]|nr:hypothetical protein [Thermodesulfobacteriota bacterium]
QGLGREWRFSERIFYKTYPCCGAMQNGLGLFERIINDHNLKPGQIQEVTVVLNPLGELPAWKNPDVLSNVDIQFNTPFLYSLLAHRVEIGPMWQSEEIVHNDEIKKFTKKIKILTHLDKEAMGRPDVTVVTLNDKGKKVYSERGVSMAAEISEEGLIDKFRRNVHGVIGGYKAEKAIDTILRLENEDDISTVMQFFVP